MERSKTLRVRVNDREWHMVEALADFEERRLSESVREAIRDAASRRGLLPISGDQQPVTAVGVQNA